MWRAAFVMDRMMRLSGLPGKSFVPLLLSARLRCSGDHGRAYPWKRCQSDRITTRHDGAFYELRRSSYRFLCCLRPPSGRLADGIWCFSLYLIGILVAIITGFILKRTALRDEAGAFVMEIPAVSHARRSKNLALRTWTA